MMLLAYILLLGLAGQAWNNHRQHARIQTLEAQVARLEQKDLNK